MDTVESIAEDIRQYALSETAAVMTEYIAICRYRTVNHYNEVRLALLIKFTLERLNSAEKRNEILRYIWNKWMKQTFIGYTGLRSVLCNPDGIDVTDLYTVTNPSVLICMAKTLYWIVKCRTNYGSNVAARNAEQLATVVEILSYALSYDRADERVREHLVSNFGNASTLVTNDLLNPDITPQPGRFNAVALKQPMQEKRTDEGQIYQPIIDSAMGANEASAGKILESIFAGFTDLLNLGHLTHLCMTHNDHQITLGYSGQEYWENNQLCANVTITVTVTRGSVRRFRQLNLLSIIQENNGGVKEAQELCARFNEKARDGLRQAYYNR